LRLADLHQRRARRGREHRGLWQPLWARPPSRRGLRRRRPAGPARGPVEEVRPLGLEGSRLPRLAPALALGARDSSRASSSQQKKIAPLEWRAPSLKLLLDPAADLLVRALHAVLHDA